MLCDIDRRKAAEFLPSDPDAAFAFRIRLLEMQALEDSMFINADALAALQILQSESHPNMQTPGSGGAAGKENLSVFGLFKFLASSPQGKTRLRQLFLQPSVDMDVIQNRHKTVALLLNSHLIDDLVSTLKKISNIRNSLASLRKGVYHPGAKASVKKGVWATLQRFAAYALELRDTVHQIHQGQPNSLMAKVTRSNITESTLSNVSRSWKRSGRKTSGSLAS